jgi:hypothetical protein
VWSNMPDGGLHSPSSFLAIKTPDPPAPEIQSPVRIVVKMARPSAFCMTFSGIFLSTLCLPFGTPSVAGLSSSA